ncbi:hypothetical protein KI387_010794 [Taxus chinensis]|uniref:Heat shock protein 70 n=1 Tax=Taxus chinensis TaxID=29808 RepID=A0AA38FMI1_TAXCH|nr:hypothetical protein KI387_010794 [Taxus chinensis]
MAKDNNYIAIGIDLGTCYSCVAVYQNERIDIIANDEGNKTIPSMVAFTAGERLIGDAAKNQFILNPDNTIFDIKRLIGKRFSDDSVQKDLVLWPFKVVCGRSNKPLVEVEYKGFKRIFSPEEISSTVLYKMKEIAETYLNSEVKNAVITVPAYFNDTQRKATKDAAAIAGLHVLQLMSEPTAAAIAYGLDTKTYSSSQGKKILVFDLGGGTLDISLLSIKNGVFEVLSVEGDTHLGGEDFDSNLVDYCAKLFKSKHQKNLRSDARALRRIRSACERAKRSLSSALETTIEIDCLYQGEDFHANITRSKFELLNMEMFEKCMRSVEKCLADAKVKKEEVDNVVLVGGSTRIPKVQQMIQEQFFSGKVLCNTINPDEAVAYGAAVQAAVLTGQRADLTVIDVTPLSLGVAVKGDLMSVVIPKNTPIPVTEEKYFPTASDNGCFRVYQGERAKAEDNIFLGEFRLSGLPAAPRGEVSVKVCFEIDGSAILKVSAEHRTSGLKEEIVIDGEDVGGLSKEEMERMLVDAERFRLEDEDFKKNVLARKALEDYAFKVRERVRKEMVRVKMERIELGSIENGVEEAIEWADRNENIELPKLQEKLEELKILTKTLDKSNKSSLCSLCSRDSYEFRGRGGVIARARARGGARGIGATLNLSK